MLLQPETVGFDCPCAECDRTVRNGETGYFDQDDYMFCSPQCWAAWAERERTRQPRLRIVRDDDECD